MTNGKSPGNDGLSKEFYVCFLNELCDSLIMALNRSFEVGQLSVSQCQAIITLIEKKDKDKRVIKNWRPISLINVDAKIASKVIAARMKNVLSNIVKYDQTTYVKGRYIGESIRLISDMLEYTKNNDVPGVLFSADFGKAFDSVEHNFIFAVLKIIWFWISVYSIDKIPSQKCRELCIEQLSFNRVLYVRKRYQTRRPTFRLPFILCVGTLFIQIRNNDDVKGVHLGDNEIKLSAYADDTDFSLLV